MQARLIGSFEMTGGWRLIDAHEASVRAPPIR